MSALLLLLILILLFIFVVLCSRKKESKRSAPSVSKRLPRDVFPDNFPADFTYRNRPPRFQPSHPDHPSSSNVNRIQQISNQPRCKFIEIKNTQRNFSNLTLNPDKRRQRFPIAQQQQNESDINWKNGSNPVEFLPQNTKTKQQIFECTICMLDGSEREVIFEPCAHVVACLKCAMKITRCPMCQSEIVTKKKVYLS